MSFKYSSNRSNSVLKSVMLVLVIFIASILISGLVFMGCWNFIMPYLFKLPTISLLQAIVFSLFIATVGSLLKGVTYDAKKS